MGKLLAIVLLLAAAGVPAYIMVRGAVTDFNVTSPEHPLGTFAAVEAWLEEKTYEPEPKGWGVFAGPAKTKRHHYKETHAAESGQFLCYVDIYVDSKGEVRKIQVEFPSRSQDVDPSYTKSQGLAFSLWNQLAGSPPVFRTDTITPALQARGLRSDLDNGRVVATWIKEYTDKDRDHSNVDTVKFTMK